jgi:predicted O-methyltransferase YrrM
MGKSAADKVLAAIEERATREFLPTVSRGQGDEIERIVRERAPRSVVEVGVMTGYATVRIARNLPDGARLTGIEIDAAFVREAEANLAEAGLADRATVVRGDAREMLGTAGERIDLVLLDAERGQYLNYLRKIEPRLAKGATIVAAGAGLAAGRLERYFDHVRLSGKYDSTHLAIDGDGMEVSVFRG